MSTDKKTTNYNDLSRFYGKYPYPAPEIDLNSFKKGHATLDGAPSHFLPLYWPDRNDDSGLEVLVAGCGTSQAAKYALLSPNSHIIGTDITKASLDHSRQLKDRYKIGNLELVQLAIEDTDRLDRQFDLIICTGVLHHLAYPELGLRSLKNALKPDGRLYLMVYAEYGRAGVYIMQELCRLLGVETNDLHLDTLRALIDSMPASHPIQMFRSTTNDLKSRNGIADALLHPSDRSYSVPQLYDLLEKCDIGLERWLHQAPYLPQFSGLGQTNEFGSFDEASNEKAYSAMELFRGTMITHRFVAAHAHHDGASKASIDGDKWRHLKPELFPGARINMLAPPKGYAAQLWNPTHGYADLLFNISSNELSIYKAMNGHSSLADIAQQVKVDENQVRSLYKKLWNFDQVMFRT